MRLKLSNWLISLGIIILISSLFYINYYELEEYKKQTSKYYNNLIVNSIENHLENAFQSNQITIENHQIILDSIAKSIFKETLKYHLNNQDVAYIALQTSDEMICINSDNKLINLNLPKITKEDFIVLHNKNNPEVFQFNMSDQQMLEIRSAIKLNLQKPLILRIGINYQQMQDIQNSHFLNSILMTIFLLIVVLLFINFQDILNKRPEPLYTNQTIINTFKKIAEKTVSGIIFINPNKKIIIFNSAAESITGISSKAVLMNDYFEIFPNDYFNLEEVFATNKSKELTHMNLINENGKNIDILYSASIINFDNEFNGVLISILDYSKLNKSEIKQASIKNIESLSKLAKGIVRAYLNKINQIYLAFQSYELNTTNSNESLTKFHDIVLSNILDLESLSKEFQDFARIPKFKYSFVVVDEVCEQIIQSCKPIYRNKKINFRKNYQPYISFYTDYKIFYEIINILVENSIESIDSEGDIIISAEFSIEEVTISITDNGCGIPKDIQNNLYNPFNTSKKGHLGFGLAKVYKYITLLDGQLSYQTNENTGTTFKLIFPNKKELKISE